MNTSGKNAPATLISVLLILAAIVIWTFNRDAGVFLGYLLPGLLLLAAMLVRFRC